MKTLFILRHAKSSWDNPNLADFERPLNERGQQSAIIMGEIISKREFRIDSLISSPANRSRQTAVSVKEHGKIETPLKIEDRVYEASVQTLQQIVIDTDEKYQSVLLIGHNPGLEGFIRFLTGEIHAMPTAAMAIIDLEIVNWHHLHAECGKLRELIRSKNQSKSESPK